MNVLVIEDNADMRFLIYHALSRRVRDADIVLVRNAADALDPENAFHPDVVVLDSNTGIKPAPETADALRARHPNVKIISFSGLPAREISWADVVVEKRHDGIEKLTAALFEASPVVE